MTAALNETEQAFVVWHGTPKNARQPSNFKDLCKSLGISQATGYRWLKRPNIAAAIDQLVREAVGGADRVMAVVDAMFNTATSTQARDRVQAATLFLRYAGVLTDKIQVSGSGEKSDIESMTDEELAREVENVQIRRAKKALSNG